MLIRIAQVRVSRPIVSASPTTYCKNATTSRCIETKWIGFNDRWKDSFVDWEIWHARMDVFAQRNFIVSRVGTAKKKSIKKLIFLVTVRPFGHSVELFNIDKQLPPHPNKAMHQKSAKKTWFGAVAGAFKKEPLSVEELDTISKHERINQGGTWANSFFHHISGTYQHRTNPKAAILIHLGIFDKR